MSRKNVRENLEKAHSSHINDLVCEDQTENPKKLYSFIKSKKCEASGVAPLSSNGISFNDSVKKSNILNDQLTSVFTVEDTTSIPKLNSTNHLSAKPIIVTKNGMMKL